MPKYCDMDEKWFIVKPDNLPDIKLKSSESKSKTDVILIFLYI